MSVFQQFDADTISRIIERVDFYCPVSVSHILEWDSETYGEWAPEW